MTHCYLKYQTRSAIRSDVGMEVVTVKALRKHVVGIHMAKNSSKAFHAD